jgi:hypothetical protein
MQTLQKQTIEQANHALSTPEPAQVAYPLANN